MTEKHTYQSIRTARQSLPLVRTIASAAVALPLVMGSAGVATIALTPVAVTEAQAFGWSDIKKGAKKVGGAVKKGAKKAGSTVKKAGKKGAKYAGKGVKKAAKVTGKVAKGAANAGLAVAAEATKVVTVGGATLLAKGLGEYDAEHKRRADKLRSDIDNAFKVDAIGRGVKKGGKWVGRQAKKSAIVRGAIKDAKAVGSRIKNVAGKLRATAKVPPERRRARSSTGHQTGKFKTGVVRDNSFRGVSKKSVARDKSVRGRPVYGNKRTKMRKVQGIRLKDIQRRKRSSRRAIGRDKSTFGRPVIGKRRKMNSRRKFNSRSFNRSRRSSNRRSLNRQTRRMSSNNRQQRSGRKNSGSRRR